MTFTSIIFLLLAFFEIVVCQQNNPTIFSVIPQVNDTANNLHGQYGYVDGSGRAFLIRYSVGSNGFKLMGENPNSLGVETEQSVQTTYGPPVLQPNQQVAQSYQQIRRFLSNPPSHQQLESIKNIEFPQVVEDQTPSLRQPFSGRYAHVIQPNQLFQPADDPYPAATAGQVKAYQEALLEEQKEEAKANDDFSSNYSTDYPTGTEARARVSISQQNQGYSYDITY